MSGHVKYTPLHEHTPTTTFDKRTTKNFNPDTAIQTASILFSDDNNHVNYVKTQQRTIDIGGVELLQASNNHDHCLINSDIHTAKQSEENRNSSQDRHPTDSWKLESNKSNNILRDCLDLSTTSASSSAVAYHHHPELRASDSRLNILVKQDNDLIDISDIKNSQTVKLAPTTLSPNSSSSAALPNSSHPSLSLALQSPASHLNKHSTGESKRVRFKSLLASTTIHESDEIVDVGERELMTTDFSTNSPDTYCDSSLSRTTTTIRDAPSSDDLEQIISDDPSQVIHKHDDDYDDDNQSNSELDEQNYNKQQLRNNNRRSILRSDGQLSRQKSPSYFKGSQHSLGRRVLNRLKTFGAIGLADKDSSHPYLSYEDKDLLTGASKYHAGKRRQSAGRTFRGSYRYSRVKISMAIFKKFCSLLVQRSTFALLGAFLIHVTLGTVYTLSNINSYLMSYMRKHGSPNATYGGSMWISSSYAVGQGLSMVLGGYIEKRFSARLACIIGCALHSISIMSTSWSVNKGLLAVLVTYGFIPGLGCGLAYMTPMSNGFGWFPNRRGLVAGFILAGFGIGTFVFNITQTAYVNPDNLSPPDDAGGYFTQKTILDRVPHLFVFIGSIYAAMQFVGCCLLFKPPLTYGSGSSKSLDERPILVETEIPLKRAIRTREFMVLFFVYGITTQGVLFVNSMLKEYGQLFIGNDMYLAWTGSMASIANSLGRLVWGLGIDRYSFTQCFTSITIIFAALMFIMPFEFILSSKLLYLLCTLGIFGSFSGWMSTYPVHLSRVFGRSNSGMIYGLIFVSQSFGGILTALGAHYLIDRFNRFVPFFCVVFLEILGLAIYHLFYPKQNQA